MKRSWKGARADVVRGIYVLTSYEAGAQRHPCAGLLVEHFNRDTLRVQVGLWFLQVDVRLHRLVG